MGSGASMRGRRLLPAPRPRGAGAPAAGCSTLRPPPPAPVSLLLDSFLCFQFNGEWIVSDFELRVQHVADFPEVGAGQPGSAVNLLPCALMADAILALSWPQHNTIPLALGFGRIFSRTLMRQPNKTILFALAGTGTYAVSFTFPLNTWTAVAAF